MEKLCLLLLASTLWIVPAPAAARADASQEKGGVLGNGVTQWTTVEINGLLAYDDGMGPHILELGTWIGYSITVDGKWFGLEFVGDREREEQLKKLVGKRVSVKGKVEERTLDGFIKRQIKVVVVSDLDAVDLADSITVQLTGEFHVSAPITYLHQAPVISVDGQMYVIEYEGAEAVFARAKKWDGKRVVLTGKLVGTNSYPVLCRCEPMQVPTVLLADIKAADADTLDDVRFTIQGRLTRMAEVPACESIPRWRIRANGREFHLTFAAKLTELVSRLEDKVVVVRGAYDFEECISVNSLGDPVVKTRMEVIHVRELKAVEQDYVRETINLQIVGELNHEVLQSEPPQHLWTIKVDDKTYELKFSPDVPKEKPGSLEGKRVVAIGRLLDDGNVLVTGIREATDR